MVYCVNGVGVSVLVGAVVVVSEAVSIFIADWFHYHCQHSSQQQQHTPHKQKTATQTRAHTHTFVRRVTHTHGTVTHVNVTLTACGLALSVTHMHHLMGGVGLVWCTPYCVVGASAGSFHARMAQSTFFLCCVIQREELIFLCCAAWVCVWVVASREGMCICRDVFVLHSPEQGMRIDTSCVLWCA